MTLENEMEFLEKKVDSFLSALPISSLPRQFCAVGDYEQDCYRQCGGSSEAIRERAAQLRLRRQLRAQADPVFPIDEVAVLGETVGGQMIG